MPGEELVLSILEPGPAALIGKLLSTQVKLRKAAGILVDAAVRDAEDRIVSVSFHPNFVSFML